MLWFTFSVLKINPGCHNIYHGGTPKSILPMGFANFHYATVTIYAW